MALSEHEQQTIEQLEEALYRQDSAFVHRVRWEAAILSARRRIGLSVFGFAVGLALLLAFCLTTLPEVGVASFIVMLVSLDTFWTKHLQMFERNADNAGAD
jgi:Protein of unknown function (DUF3040)